MALRDFSVHKRVWEDFEDYFAHQEEPVRASWEPSGSSPQDKQVFLQTPGTALPE